MKILIRNLFVILLRIKFARKLLIKIIEATLLTKDLDGFKQIQFEFLDFMRNTRLHVINSGQDIDLTYLKSNQLTTIKDSTLLKIVEQTSKVMSEITQNINESLKIKKLDPSFQIQNADFGNLFLTVPELTEPDNHYIFLLALATAINAKKIVEVGTASGTSLCSFLLAKNVDSVTTFDLKALSNNKSWVSADSCAEITKFLDHQKPRWTQYVANLEKVDEWYKYRNFFLDADLVFVDTQHLGPFEELMGTRFVSELSKKTVFVWDDIRLSSMCEFWEMLKMKKIDVSGLGHYSGTGISMI